MFLLKVIFCSDGILKITIYETIRMWRSYQKRHLLAACCYVDRHHKKDVLITCYHSERRINYEKKVS